LEESRVETLHHQESQKSRNAKHRNPERGTSTRVSDTGSWRSQESRLFITGVLNHAKCETPKSRNRHINRSFRYQELEESRVETLHHRSPKVRNVKRQNPETGTSTGVSDTGSWRSQESRLFITGVPKCRNTKCRNTFCVDFGYWEWSVKTLHHKECRNVEMSKCEKHLLV
jgi:hypothetical protein